MRGRTAVVLLACLVPLALLATAVALILLVDEDERAAGLCDGTGVQITVDTSDLPEVPGYELDQLRNAAVITEVAGQRGLDQEAAVIGVMTALAESGLRNLANAGEFAYPPTSTVMTAEQWRAARAVAVLSTNYPNDGVATGDWDSVGLFQGRPSAGWGGDGPPEQQVQNLLNPTYTAGRFFDALTALPNWRHLDPGDAAQAVQRSAFPDAYDRHETPARLLVAAVQGIETTLEDLAQCAAPVYAGLISDSGWATPVPARTAFTGQFHDARAGYTHQGADLAAPMGSPIYAAADGVVIGASCSAWQGRSPCNVRIDHGTDATGARITTLYVHMYPDGVHVRVGDPITAGDHIGDVGSNGNSTGAHLHLEVWVDDEPVDPLGYLRSQGVQL